MTITFESLTATLYVIFVATISLFILCLVAYFVDYLLDKKASRWVKITRFNPDKNGNRPYFFHFRTGYSYEPEPGNREALPPIFVHGLQPTLLDPGKPSKSRSTSITASGKPSGYFVEEIDIPVNSVNTDLTLSNQDLQNLPLGKFTDLQPKMIELIKEGRTKTDVLTQLGLVGRHHKSGSAFYEKVLFWLKESGE